MRKGWGKRRKLGQSNKGNSKCSHEFMKLADTENWKTILKVWVNKNNVKYLKCSSIQQLRNKAVVGASLVAQWLRICLPMQWTRVRALVWEDPTYHGATKPVHHNYWACALEPASHNYWARVPQLLKPMHLEPVLRNKRSHRNKKPAHSNEEQPPLAATRESPREAKKTECSQK